MDRISFSNTLKCKRESLNISKYKVSKDTGLTSLQINRIEDAVNSYSMGNIFKYLKAIGCNLQLVNNCNTDVLDCVEKFGSWFTKRRDSDMSMYSLAKQIGSNVVTITKIETARSTVGVDLFLKIVDAFGYKIKIESV